MIDPPAPGAPPSPDSFDERLLGALEALAGGEFAVRLERSHERDVEDSIAFLFNVMAEQLGGLFEGMEHEKLRLEGSALDLSEALSAMAAADFTRRATRSYDGSPHDVLAFLVNSTADELGTLYRELEGKNAALERRAHEAAAEQLASMKTLAAGVGHELRNPLAAAAGSVEYIMRIVDGGELDSGAIDDLRQALADADLALHRASKVAEEIALLNPLKTPERARLQVADVAETAIKMLRNVISHRATLRTSHTGTDDVEGDEARLGQVVLNLVQNAVLAFPPDRRPEDALISVSTYPRTDGRAVIEVADNGIGMSVAQQRRIFEAFYTTRPVGEGTGLGLSISQRLVEDHGGEINVTSAEGKGSVFRVILPTVPTNSSAAPVRDHGHPAKGHLAGKNVLIIDDDRLVVRAITRLLQPVHHITSAATGNAGLALVEQGEWDAIITDLMLPDIDGQQVYEQICARRPEIVGRVGFITGGTFTNEADEFLRNVDSPVLYKPFSRDQLLTLVDELCG